MPPNVALAVEVNTLDVVVHHRLVVDWELVLVSHAACGFNRRLFRQQVLRLSFVPRSSRGERHAHRRVPRCSIHIFALSERDPQECFVEGGQ
jgi:hypothetical protein